MSAYQSVLDWKSPDEERKNPSKLDRFGDRLESFHALRTRDTNNRPDEWTVKHAIHVARWEAYQAGNKEAFKDPLGVFESFDLMLVIEELQRIHRSGHWFRQNPARGDYGFVEASAQAIFNLESSTHHAVASLQKKRFPARDGTDAHWTGSFPPQAHFLAARMSSPTGTLPVSLEKTLENLGLSEYLHFKNRPRPEGSISGSTETALKRQQKLNSNIDDRIKAALEKQRQLQDSTIEERIKAALERQQTLSDSIIQDHVKAAVEKQQKLSDSIIQDHVKAAVEKQRTLDHSIIQDSIKAVLKTEAGPYRALLSDYMEFTDHLAKGLTTFSGLADKADNLKNRWLELDPTAPKEAVQLLQKFEAGESSQAEQKPLLEEVDHTNDVGPDPVTTKPVTTAAQPKSDSA